MSHYYKNDESLEDKIKTIKVNVRDLDLTFKTNSGVFSKDGLDYGSRVLINNVLLNDSKIKIADVGSGYGPIGISLAKLYPNSNVFMFDVNERAVNLSIENAKINNVLNIEANISDILSKANNYFDVVVTNPPIRAGKDIVFKIYEESYEKLVSGGVIYSVIQRKQGAPSSFNKLLEVFGNCEVIDKNKGYWILYSKKL